MEVAIYNFLTRAQEVDMPYSQIFKHKMIQKMIVSDAVSATAHGFCLSAAAIWYRIC